MKILRGLFFAVMIIIPVVAGATTYDDVIADSKRVGLEELQNISVVEFESGSYRLDPDFRVGYGDVLAVELWGKIEGGYRLEVNREGDVRIPPVGKIKLFGLTMDQARNVLRTVIGEKYSNVEFSINLADVKDIRINVLGNAKNPGLYAVSPFCRVVEVLAKSGGPDENGTLIGVEVIRDGKIAAVFNLYNFLRKNDQSQNIRMKHGDTIYIPKTKNLITITGDIRYPGIYEVEAGGMTSDVLELAGGMLPTKFGRRVLLLRINSSNKLKETFEDLIFSSDSNISEKDDIVLENDDHVIVSTELNYSPNPEPLYKTVYLEGKFAIPGEYLVDETDTISAVIKKAGGVKEVGFIKGAVYRKNTVREIQKNILDKLVLTQREAILEEEIYLMEAVLTEEEKLFRQQALESKKKALAIIISRVPDGRVIIDLGDILEGKSDINLEEGDSLFIPSIPDWVLVSGAINNPQSVLFKLGTDVDYYINVTGGLNSLADEDSIYVIKANGSAESKSGGIGKISRGDVIIVPEKI